MNKQQILGILAILIMGGLLGCEGNKSNPKQGEQSSDSKPILEESSTKSEVVAWSSSQGSWEWDPKKQVVFCADNPSRYYTPQKAIVEKMNQLMKASLEEQLAAHTFLDGFYPQENMWNPDCGWAVGTLTFSELEGGFYALEIDGNQLLVNPTSEEEKSLLKPLLGETVLIGGGLSESQMSIAQVGPVWETLSLVSY